MATGVRMRPALRAVAFAATVAGIVSIFACARSEPPAAAPQTTPGSTEPLSSPAQPAPAPSEAQAPPPKPVAPNQNPKDDPASCIDPDLASATAWIEAQRRHLDAQLATSTACYQRASKKNAALEGKLRMSFHYDKKKKRPEVNISASSIEDCQLVACIQRLATNSTSHAVPPQTSFTYTLEFKQGSPPTRPQSEEPFTGEHCAQKARGTQYGRLPPAIIQNVVRDNYRQFRLCYERGLARDPTLAGSIHVRFIIDRDGSVSSAGVFKNEIPDCDVARCVLPVYRSLRFPKPEGGIVTVVYPIMFAPG